MYEVAFVVIMLKNGYDDVVMVKLIHCTSMKVLHYISMLVGSMFTSLHLTYSWQVIHCTSMPIGSMFTSLHLTYLGKQFTIPQCQQAPCSQVQFDVLLVGVVASFDLMPIKMPNYPFLVAQTKNLRSSCNLFSK